MAMREREQSMMPQKIQRSRDERFFLKKNKIGRSFTHDHVFQRVLGQPAIEKYRDEEVSEGRQNHLPRR